MKKWILMLMCTLLMLAGCAMSNKPVTSPRENQEDLQVMADGTIMFSGGFNEDHFQEFYRATLNPDIKHYTIMIMSAGGDAYNTLAIMHRIEKLQKRGVKFTTIIPGHGFSAGAFIFMMGDERIMYPGSVIMFHSIHSQWVTKSRPIPDTVHRLFDIIDTFVVEQFKKKFPHISDEWIDRVFWTGNNAWLSATEARLMGIATSVEE